LALWVIESVIVYMDVCHGSIGKFVHPNTCMWVGPTLVAMATTFGLGAEPIAYRLVIVGVSRRVCRSTTNNKERKANTSYRSCCSFIHRDLLRHMPCGLTMTDGKRPDGLTLIPWQAGKPLTWDVTVISTLADSYVHLSSRTAGGVAETAANRKMSKYADLPATNIFQPLAFETHGATHSSALDFLNAVAGE